MTIVLLVDVWKKINTIDGLRRMDHHWHDSKDNKTIGYNYNSSEDPADHSDNLLKII